MWYDVDSFHHVTTSTLNKMADDYVSFRQRAVIKFETKKQIPAAEMHQRLECVNGNLCMAASSVRRWMRHFQEDSRASTTSLVAVALE